MFKENQTIKVITEDIEKSFVSEIKEIKDNSIVLKQVHEGLGDKEPITCFSVIDDGIIYFESTLNANTCEITLPLETDIIQRREFKRIPANFNIEIKIDGEISNATCIDISLGGLKVFMDKKVEIGKDYSIKMFLDTKNIIETNLNIIKCVENSNNQYKISGRFKNINNIDKITLVQYCHKKQAEIIKE